MNAVMTKCDFLQQMNLFYAARSAALECAGLRENTKSSFRTSKANENVGFLLPAFQVCGLQNMRQQNIAGSLVTDI